MDILTLDQARLSWRFPIVTVLILVLIIALVSGARPLKFKTFRSPIDAGRPVPPENPSLPFVYRFRGNGVLYEKDVSGRSGNPYWWLDSGAKLIISGEEGSTVLGELARFDRWRQEYSTSNAIDTDGGFHPQNIFRLVTRSRWQDARQTLYFQIKRDNLSDSQNRNESNGVLLFNRYQDGDNLYYAGIRVDGTAVIKKKYRGEYYTLAQVPVFTGRAYDRDHNPNLLPKNEWLGIQAEVRDRPGGEVEIKLFFDRQGTGNWQLILSAVDRGDGTPVISGPGFGGIRTDFMDVVFWQYRVSAV